MDKNVITYVVGIEDNLVYLRDVFRKKIPLSHALLARLKVQEKIQVNGQVTHTNYRLQPGDIVTVNLNLEERSHIIPQNIPLDIVYQDTDIMVINKQPGLAVHPVKNKMEGTLANALTFYWMQQGESRLFRPINRLDKGTSGLMLVGKSQYSHQAMFRQQKKGLIQRGYQALVEGEVKTDSGTIDLPIGHAEPGSNACRQVDTAAGKPAITHFRVINRYRNYTLLSLNLETGRTHQIRVHLSYLGCPICGDILYGSESPLIDRQALHASQISFLQPRSLEPLQFEVPPPADMLHLLSILQPLP